MTPALGRSAGQAFYSSLPSSDLLLALQVFSMRMVTHMPRVTALAGRFVEGLPYLQKEVARRASLRTGKVLTTPSNYYVIFSGRCNLACPFCTIHKVVDPTLSEEVMFRIVREAK